MNIHEIATQTVAAKAVKKLVPLLKSDKTLAALASIASTNKSRVTINAVFVEKRTAIATNGRILLAVPYSGEIPDGRICLTATGMKAHALADAKRAPADKSPADALGTLSSEGANVYPNWRQVVPAIKALASYTLTPQDEQAIQIMGEDAKEQYNPSNPAAGDIISIQIGDERCFLSLWHLARIIAALRKLKVAGPLVIQPTLVPGLRGHQSNPCLITAASAPEMVAVIMVARPQDKCLALN